MNPQHLEQLKAERDRLRREIAQLQGRLDGIETALSIVTGETSAQSNAPESTPTKHSRGTVKTTVLNLVEEHKVSGLTTFEVVELAAKQGVRLDRGSVSSLLSKLKAEGTLSLRDGNKYVPKPYRAVIVERNAA